MINLALALGRFLISLSLNGSAIFLVTTFKIYVGWLNGPISTIVYIYFKSK
ncbi:conserved exported protein of unknown function [Legionella longbeachae NSW150]|uniref:Uncharacterized protein n=1 Tax=Legionella longbeachae serogroup 1 (strain NSW150) TaxID=661367 RepID=D3HPV8_LEGLN|nr:conserved exported protein of unknown function [Legionella longbeachae NSW150]